MDLLILHLELGEDSRGELTCLLILVLPSTTDSILDSCTLFLDDNSDDADGVTLGGLSYDYKIKPQRCQVHLASILLYLSLAA
jgi:hypothetical protein